ncbi:serine/threonine-protein kinase [Amycolatopsis sp. NBC_01480]|uniref:serine/threonine-protein kinase n=1 Tax=Amycolatopsis sp. NBC_01480 TaxID=2903562 RepID=UPI002E2DFC88|nr:protein kinase [Amycolatopsis sp. NBC_01480]
MSSEGSIVGGRYRLDQPIGRGRAGIVWLAFDTRLFRTVAMKRMYLPVGLPPDRAEQARAMAMQEGKDAARVEHPCAITVFDVLPDGQDVWLVMEYIPSRGMSTFLAEHGRLTPEQAASLGILLGDAMAAMHAAGIIHRTLEPGTVLLADDGGVKLTDIGITGGGPHAAYRAPEVTRGGAPSPAADVFSLGATLYTAVEGVPPFGDDGNSSERPAQNAGVLTGALRKMLRTDPATRPTMADSVSALSAITEGGEQTAFVPPTAPAMPASWAQPGASQPPGLLQPGLHQQGLPSGPQQQPYSEMPTQQHQPPVPLMQVPVQQVPYAPAPPQPMAQQPTQQISPQQAPMPPQSPTARFVPSPAQQAATAEAAAEKAAARRKLIMTVAAILCAVLIGIGVSQLLFV